MKKVIIGMLLGFSVLLGGTVALYFGVLKDKESYKDTVEKYDEAVIDMYNEYNSSVDSEAGISEEYSSEVATGEEVGTDIMTEENENAVTQDIPEELADAIARNEIYKNSKPTPVYENMVFNPESWIIVARAKLDCERPDDVWICDELEKIKEFLEPAFYNELLGYAEQLDNKVEIATPEEEVIERDEAKVKIFNEQGYPTDVLYYSDYVALYGEPSKDQIIGYEKYFGSDIKEESTAFYRYDGNYVDHLITYIGNEEYTTYRFERDLETNLIYNVKKEVYE